MARHARADCARTSAAGAVASCAAAGPHDRVNYHPDHEGDRDIDAYAHVHPAPKPDATPNPNCNARRAFRAVAVEWPRDGALASKATPHSTGADG